MDRTLLEAELVACLLRRDRAQAELRAALAVVEAAEAELEECDRLEGDP